MKRRIGYVESIDYANNTCKVRVPSLDGFDENFYRDNDLMNLRIIRTQDENLQEADIPMTLQGLRKGDIVYCIDSDVQNDNYVILGFFGATH